MLDCEHTVLRTTKIQKKLNREKIKEQKLELQKVEDYDLSIDSLKRT